ncbi:MAG TPA: hypothetical protein DCO75_10700 [Fibrobacteres bacterium]|nr:hypothetical protein [Fibrobacterota bacterium]
MKQIAGLIVIVSSIAIFAQINLTGTVTEAIHGAPVQGVVVTLKSTAGIFDSTDAQGQYKLIGQTSVLSNPANENIAAGAKICGNALHFTVSVEAPLSIEAFNATGVKCATLFYNGSPAKGSYNIALTSCGLAEGMYIIRINQCSRQTVLHATILSRSASSGSAVYVLPRHNESGLARHASASISDTLIFVKTGFKISSVPVTVYTGSNNAVMFDSATSQSIVSVGVSADYSAGNIGQYDILNGTSNTNLLSIYSDNDVRAFNGSVYVLERSGKDNVIKITGSVISASTVAYEKNIGASVNIQDMAFIDSTKAYITQYGSAMMAIFNPSTGLKSSTIDLSDFDTYAKTDSADDVPYMSRELYYNGKVYVACQRLKAPAGGYIQAADTSKIVVINATTDSVEKTIDLIYKNPVEMYIWNEKLYVASVGIWGISDAGIEQIDLSADTNAGSVVGEPAFSGDIASVIVVSDTKGYAVISDLSTYATSLYSFNPQTKTAGDKITGIDAPSSGHIAFDGKYVYVGDRSSTSPGIVVIDPATDLKVGDTKYVGLPPNSLEFLKIE